MVAGWGRDGNATRDESAVCTVNLETFSSKEVSVETQSTKSTIRPLSDPSVLLQFFTRQKDHSEVVSHVDAFQYNIMYVETY
jgi:hypothetical protein